MAPSCLTAEPWWNKNPRCLMIPLSLSSEMFISSSVIQPYTLLINFRWEDFEPPCSYKFVLKKSLFFLQSRRIFLCRVNSWGYRIISLWLKDRESAGSNRRNTNSEIQRNFLKIEGSSWIAIKSQLQNPIIIQFISLKKCKKNWKSRKISFFGIGSGSQ